MYRVSSLFQASPLQGAIALAVACFVSIIGLYILHYWENKNNNVVFLNRLLLASASLCFVGTFLYYFIGMQYV